MFSSMQSSGFFKGVTAGLIIGAAVTMLADPVTDRQRGKLCRKTEGMFKNMGSMLDSCLGMFH